MKQHDSRMAVSGVFAVIIGFTAFHNGSSLIVSIGAGLLGGAIYYLISRWIQQ